MAWPLLGTTHLVLTVWNLRRFRGQAPQPGGGSAPEPPDSAAAASGGVERGPALEQATAPGDPGLAPVLATGLGGQEPPRGDAPPAPQISVVIPARDEAAGIGACIASVRAQDLPEVEVLIIDDGSTDGTADAARAAADEDPRVRVIATPEPEAGWSGQAWACARGYEEARGRWLVFLDADVTLAPGALQAALAAAEDASATLVAWCPREAAGPPLQALASPLHQDLLLALAPLELLESHPDPRLAWPFAGCLLVERGSYLRAGGHAGTPAATATGLALTRAVKAAGGRVLLRDAGAGTVTGPLAGPPAVLEALRRRLYPALGGSDGPCFGLLAAVAVLYVLPPLAALVGWLAGWPGLATAGLLQTLLAIAGRALQVVQLGRAPWTAPLAPLAAGAWLGLVLMSRQAWRKGGVPWKGRACPAPVAPKAGTG